MNSKGIDISKLKKSADYVRYLVLESIERANSGHPGLPLGCAELGVLLYRYILRFNPGDPGWANRDRFILSAGHGSMLLYSLLYLVGYPISLEDIGKFRQLQSKTPGHPEYEISDGIETTTGPLGQGFANAVGCAIEGKMLAERFNLFDYTVYTLMGDGCNMEGISYEAGSLAGHLGLDNLIAIYDSNSITIDGRTDLTFSEDVAKRYKAQDWHVDKADISDIEDVFKKLKRLKELKGKPKLLVLKTIIGEGLNKKKDTAGIHGAPAGIDEITYFIQNSHIKELFEKEYKKEFEGENGKKELIKTLEDRIENKPPLLEEPGCRDFMKEGLDELKKNYSRWNKKLQAFKKEHPRKYETYFNFKLPRQLKTGLLNFKSFSDLEKIKPTATRGISGEVLNLCADEIPQIVGGCADLVGSTKAAVKSSSPINRGDFSGRNIVFGVREHAMGAIGNGVALNKTMIPFSSTFFVFFDYIKPAVRLAALMKLNHLFIFSHDSIYVGEDGPTHQPIEHLNALRLIPGIYAFRPANDIETAFSFLYFLQKMNGPVAIVTTRQKLPAHVFSVPADIKRETLYERFEKGGYVFYETEGSKTPGIILAGSGSELSLALETAKLIETKDKKQVRVVSIPCLELLKEADISYREQLFTPGIPLVLIEAASHRGVNLFYDQRVILIDIEVFGESAPGEKVGEHFGLTPEAICEQIAEKQG